MTDVIGGQRVALAVRAADLGAVRAAGTAAQPLVRERRGAVRPAPIARRQRRAVARAAADRRSSGIRRRCGGRCRRRSGTGGGECQRDERGAWGKAVKLHRDPSCRIGLVVDGARRRYAHLPPIWRLRDRDFASGLRAEQRVDRKVARLARRAHLAPRALVGILVRPEADEPRAVSEAVLLELVVADLGNELRLQRDLLEVAGAPAVRLREHAVVLLVDQQRPERSDLVVLLRADGARADVVELSVVGVQPEQQRRDLRAAAGLQRRPTTTQSAVLYGFTLT